MARPVYDEKFYSSQSEPSSRSAFAVVPILMDLIHPSSVVDVGCGLGTWLKAFRENGVTEIFGIDGEYIDRKRLQIPKDCFASMDLNNPISLSNRRFDLALCLEVAEHVRESSAGRLVHFLTGLAPVVVFSAAVPGQGGAGHLNEQWQDYWADIFANKGYSCLDVIRPKIWNLAEVEPWYCQNSFLFVQTFQLDRYPEVLASSSWSAHLPLRIVHPGLFRRFARLEYVQSRQMACELIARIRRKVLRKRS